MPFAKGVRRDTRRNPDAEESHGSRSNGSIYYHPNLGTYALPSRIRDTWGNYGWENSCLGYPVSDEFVDAKISIPLGGSIPTKTHQWFERGIIYWDLNAGNSVSCW